MSSDNGNGIEPAVISDSRRHRYEAGLMAVAEVEQERDDLRKILDETTAKLRSLQAEHDALKLAYARQQTEIDSYRRDRDYAVGKRAEAEAVFGAVLAIMQKHKGKTVIEENAPSGVEVSFVGSESRNRQWPMDREQRAAGPSSRNKLED